MKTYKESTWEIKVRHAKKDRKLATLLIILMLVAYFVTDYNLALGIFVICVTFIGSTAFIVQNHFSEIEERLDLIEEHRLK